MSSTNVQLSGGAIAGVEEEGVVAFRGIPYAKPPIGNLRFAPPEPVEAWSDVFDASRNGPIAPQPDSRAFAVMGPLVAEQGEDCLSLNVWVPTDASGPLPVVIWLHGGGFGTGAGSLAWYDGGRLARDEGVIVVGVNYRLGALGYLTIPGVVPGNLGTRDEIAALQWVQKEIGAFGGDPKAVTLMGQSAGAHAIASFLTMEQTDGLFHRGIMQSFPSVWRGMARERADQSATTFLGHLGLSRDDDDLLAKLRAVPVDKILDAQGKSIQEISKLAEGVIDPVFMPVEDEAPYDVVGRTIPETAGMRAAERGIAFLIGTTKDESNLFLSVSPYVGALKNGDVEVAACKIAGTDELAEYLPDEDAAASAPARFEAFVTALVFGGPATSMAIASAEKGGKAFVYRFDWESPMPGLGAPHCIELPFMFGNKPAWTEAAMLEGVSETDVDALIADMMSRWGGFIRSGEPGFPAFSAADRPMLHIDSESHVENASVPAMA
jgi:para-nitrobenzyl esterase